MIPVKIPPNLPPDEPLRTYIAVQVKPDEHPIRVVEAFVRTAGDVKILFRHLELLDTISIGTVTFARMRTDILNPEPILGHLHESGRAVVSSPRKEYEVRLSGGRTGRVSNLIMHATPKVGQSRMFRGTRFKFWERQFEVR